MPEPPGRAVPYLLAALGAAVVLMLVAILVVITMAGAEALRPRASAGTETMSAEPVSIAPSPAPTPSLTAAACAASADPATSEEWVRVYFPCGLDGLEVRAVQRSIGADAPPEARLAAAVDALLMGPSGPERAAGFGSAVPAIWADFGHAVSLTAEGLAVIDFERSILALGAPNTAAQMHALTSSLGRTALESGGATRVELHVGGSCGAFIVWMGEITDCRIAGAEREPSAAGTRWVLDLAIVDGERLPVVTSILVGEESISGFVLCSQYELGIQGVGDAIRIGSFVVTERSCTDSPNAHHDAYLGALGRLTAARIVAEGLVLSGQDVELRFSR